MAATLNSQAVVTRIREIDRLITFDDLPAAREQAQQLLLASQRGNLGDLQPILEAYAYILLARVALQDPKHFDDWEKGWIASVKGMEAARKITDQQIKAMAMRSSARLMVTVRDEFRSSRRTLETQSAVDALVDGMSKLKVPDEVAVDELLAKAMEGAVIA